MKVVLFDWDGTLFDVFDFLYDTYTAVFRRYGLTPWRRQDYRNRFRSDWRGLLKEMGLAPHEDALISLWDQNKSSASLRMHRQAKHVLSRLHEDVTLGIVSAAPAAVLARELKQQGVADLFDVVVAYEDTDAHKPDPLPLTHALTQLNTLPAQAVYVGDMAEDIQAAHAAGTTAVAVTWGIHSQHVLAKQKPTFTAHTFTELEEYIQGLP